MARLLPRGGPARAAAVLREVFSGVEGPLVFRLWDGTEVPLSGDKPMCTVAIKSPEAFLHLIRNPSPYFFAEAYVQGKLDLEGDLVSVIPVATQIAEMTLPLPQKLRR